MLRHFSGSCVCSLKPRTSEKNMKKLYLVLAAAMAFTTLAAGAAEACGPYASSPQQEAERAVLVALERVGATPRIERVEVAMSSAERGTAMVRLRDRRQALRLSLVNHHGRWRVALAR
jgi:hypothetical protein